MYVIIDYSEKIDKYLIQDTKDGEIEEFTIDQICEFIGVYGVHIKGVHYRHGKMYIKPVYKDYIQKDLQLIDYSEQEQLRILNRILIEELERAYVLGLNLEETSPRIRITRTKNSYGLNKRILNKNTNTYYHEISISQYVFLASLEEIRTIIAHEVCHSVKDSLGHDAKWVAAIQRMKNNYDYTFSNYHLNDNPYSSKLESSMQEAIALENDFNYVVYCTKCNSEWKYKNATSIVKHPSRYLCKKCNSELKSKKL